MTDAWLSLPIPHMPPPRRYVREGDWVVWNRPVFDKKGNKTGGVAPEYVRLYLVERPDQLADVMVETARGLIKVHVLDLEATPATDEERQHYKSVEPDWLEWPQEQGVTA